MHRPADISKENSDAELLAAFVATGSQAAFATLANRYAGLAYGAALRTTASKPLAEEAAQNAFVVLARKARQLDASGGLGAWLHRTSYFEAKKLLERERRYRQRLDEFRDEPTTALTGGDTVPDSGDLSPDLDQAIAALKPDEHQVVVLRYFHGHTFDEIAALHGGQPATWRKRSSRAIENLRTRLASRRPALAAATLTTALAALLPHHAPAALVTRLSKPAFATATSTGLLALIAMTSKAKITAATVIVVLAAAWAGHAIIGDREPGATAPLADTQEPVEPISPQPKPADTAQTDADAQLRADWLAALREHLFAPGPPHDENVFSTWGPALPTNRPRSSIYRSPFYDYHDFTGGEIDGVVDIMREALFSDRATVAYRTLGYYGHIRAFVEADGARDIIRLVGTTDSESLAMYGLNILGQYSEYLTAEMARPFAALLSSGGPQTKIALAYYGSNYAGEHVPAAFGDALAPLLQPYLEDPDPLTRLAAASLLAGAPDAHSPALVRAFATAPLDGLRPLHAESTLDKLADVSPEAARPVATELAAFLDTRLEADPTSEALHRAFDHFAEVIGKPAGQWTEWKAAADEFAANRLTKPLPAEKLLDLLDNPLARELATLEIGNRGPNARHLIPELLERFEADNHNASLADAIHRLDFHKPRLMMDMRSLAPALTAVDQALAASADPAHQTFRADLDLWMMEEPQLNYTDLKNLAEDIGDLDPTLRDTFIATLKTSHLKDIAAIVFP